MKKQIIAALLVLFTLLAFASCKNSGGQSSSSSAESIEISIEELAAYNGVDGAPAYVAVDGVIYDVTNAPKWENGVHENGVKAGADLSTEIRELSPHGLKVLDKLTAVGTLS